MLIQSGRVSSLAALPWAALELTSESRTDEIVLHLVRWAVRNLESSRPAIPFQLLYPIARRRAAAPELLSPYLWMRTPQPSRDLARVTSIMGLQGILRDAKGKPILTSHVYVDSVLIARCRACADSWSAGITLGSGVRVLLGHSRGLCGTVDRLHDNGDADVQIALRSHAVRLRIPVGALAHLGHQPSDYFEKEED